jgi:hypothetical protein
LAQFESHISIDFFLCDAQLSTLLKKSLGWYVGKNYDLIGGHISMRRVILTKMILKLFRQTRDKKKKNRKYNLYNKYCLKAKQLFRTKSQSADTFFPLPLSLGFTECKRFLTSQFGDFVAVKLFMNNINLLVMFYLVIFGCLTGHKRHIVRIIDDEKWTGPRVCCCFDVVWLINKA